MKDQGHINVFIAYARKDGEYLKRLRTYLRPLDRNRTIKIWYDGEIVPGTPWEADIKKHLHEAEIILLLVSANSLASDYFYEKEVADALERHKEEKAIVVPVILSDCAWEFTDLHSLQALPKDGKPISSWSDGAMVKIRKIAENMGDSTPGRPLKKLVRKGGTCPQMRIGRLWLFLLGVL